MTAPSKPRMRVAAINWIQFQQGLSLAGFMEQRGAEAKCRKVLDLSRWPKDFRRAVCTKPSCSMFRRGHQTHYQCRACGHQTTLASGTLLRSTHLPLTTWFLATRLPTATKSNLAALELIRRLEWCYRTTWRLKHKTAQDITESEAGRRSGRFVRGDGTCLTGERNGSKVGRGSENKQSFGAAAKTEATLRHPWVAVLEPVRNFNNAAIIDFARYRPTLEVEVYTDGLAVFPRFVDDGPAHTVLVIARGRAVTGVHGARWANIIRSNIERPLDGICPSLKHQRYARRYLGESAYRFNRRSRPPATRAAVPASVAPNHSCAEPATEPLLRTDANQV